MTSRSGTLRMVKIPVARMLDQKSEKVIESGEKSLT